MPTPNTTASIGDIDAISLLQESGLTAQEIASAIKKSKDINSTAIGIDTVIVGERKIPIQFNTSLLPNLRVWRDKNNGLFKTNAKAKKLFEDVFADKIVYVDGSVSVTGDGSVNSPFKTIYEGVRVKPFNPSLGGNLTVYVKAGIYTDTNGFNATGVFAYNINIIGYGGLVYANHTSTTTHNFICFESTNHYIENIVFSGGKSPLHMFSQADKNPIMMFKNCGFNSSLVENGVNVKRNGLYIFENCMSKDNFLDGFNYHNADTIKNQLVIEINCKATNNGVGGGGTDNGSTIHDGGNIIRLNGEYYSNSDRNIHDINNCRSWNLGCISRDGVDITQGNFAVGVDSNDTSIMWLDACVTYGSNKALDKYLNTSSTIYVYDLKDTCLIPYTSPVITYDYRTI